MKIDQTSWRIKIHSTNIKKKNFIVFAQDLEQNVRIHVFYYSNWTMQFNDDAETNFYLMACLLLTS